MAEVTKIVVTDEGFLYLPLYYAHHKNFFGQLPKGHKIEIVRSTMRTDASAFSMLMDVNKPQAHGIDIAVCDPAVILTETEPSMRPVALARLINSAFWAVAHNASTVQVLNDLKAFDRLIAFKKGTTSFGIATRIFEDAGKAGAIVQVNPGEELVTLREGPRSTIALSPDILGIRTLLETKGDQFGVALALAETAEYRDVLVTAILTRRDVLEKKVDLIQGFLAAIQDALVCTRRPDSEVISYASHRFGVQEHTVQQALAEAHRTEVYPIDIKIGTATWMKLAEAASHSWQRGFDKQAALDAYHVFVEPYSKLVKSYEQSVSSSATVPAQKPAALETIWDKGKLNVPRTPAKSNLSKKKLEAALAALRAELLELAGDVNVEANMDKRPAEFLHRIAGRIPKTVPRQDELFRLGHAETIFASYAKTVAQEWPDFLAARYHAVSLQFDRTMRQSPLWREFVANAAKQTMSAAQIADSSSLASEVAKALKEEEAPAFVDPTVPQALEQLAEALPGRGEPDAVKAGKELLAADLVESVNNTLKPIAEVALASAGDYAEGFGKGFKKAAKKQGPVDGAKAFKWLRRLAVGGGAGAGSFVALSNLITKFPEAFGWLERVLHVLR